MDSATERYRIHPLGPITSLEEFVGVSTKLIRESGIKQSTAGLWWRGQADESWKLIPTLYRSKINAEQEREINRDFRIKSLPFLTSHRPSLEIEWLFLMQHHGAPTRILDWTESSLVALYFAVSNFEHPGDSAVWALHPWLLNTVTDRQQTIPTSNSDKIKNYVIDIDDVKVPRVPEAKLPLALRVEYGFNRAHSQRGAATIHGADTRPIESIKGVAEDIRGMSNTSKDRLLKKIVIKKESKFEILKSLYEHGIGADILFPDLDGLAAALRFRYDHRYLGTKLARR
jgi:hypothetical protein